MSDPNLTESAWQRAKVDAAGVYRTTTFQLGGALLTAICSSLALIAQEGQPTTTQAAVAVLAAAVAILLSVVVVLVCQLAAAPVRQRNELRAAWEIPEIETVNIGLTLRDFHRKGTELRHRFSQMIGRRGEQEVEQWADGAVRFLSKHAPEDDVQAFLSAGESERGAIRRLDIRLRTLQTIIDGLG
jgi:hypothetical protein